MVTMLVLAALGFAKDVRRIKKAGDVIAALQNAIPANFLTVTTFSTIGILAILNVMLRFADLGTLIAQYNQF